MICLKSNKLFSKRRYILSQRAFHLIHSKSQNSNIETPTLNPLYISKKNYNA